MTHALYWRMERGLKGMTIRPHMPFVPVAGCGAKYSVMADLRRKLEEITCSKCRKRKARHDEIIKMINAGQFVYEDGSKLR